MQWNVVRAQCSEGKEEAWKYSAFDNRCVVEFHLASMSVVSHLQDLFVGVFGTTRFSKESGCGLTVAGGRPAGPSE